MTEETRIFIASRLTAGNFLFPGRIEITPDRVSRIKPTLTGSDEESITISKVASVSIHTGLVWADIRIDSTGGTNPIASHGHTKEDAGAIRDLIQRHQKSTRTAD